MTSLEIERAFHGLAEKAIELIHDGDEKFVVHTPFMFDDGDHFVILLKRIDGVWSFTDEGHTLMHLSYGGFKMTAARAMLVKDILLAAKADNRDGELILAPVNGEIGIALFAFTQMLIKITEAAKWTREQVRSTFTTNFCDLLSGNIPPDRLSFGYVDRGRDPEGKYVVDCKVNGMPRPLYIFGVNNNLKCNVATIAILKFRSWGQNFDTVAIFEDQSRISRKSLARFSDVVDKQFSSIGAEREIVDYLEDHVPGLPTAESLDEITH